MLIFSVSFPANIVSMGRDGSLGDDWQIDQMPEGNENFAYLI
jgi:hypothetical protein